MIDGHEQKVLVEHLNATSPPMQMGRAVRIFDVPIEERIEHVQSTPLRCGRGTLKKRVPATDMSSANPHCNGGSGKYIPILMHTCIQSSDVHNVHNNIHMHENMPLTYKTATARQHIS